MMSSDMSARDFYAKLGEWGEVGPINAGELEEGAPFPVGAMDAFAPIVDAVLRGGGIENFAPLVYMSALVSLSTLAAPDFAIATLGRRPAPMSMFAVGFAESGWRKTTLMSPLWEGHEEADDYALAVHAHAKANEAKDQNAPRVHRYHAMRYRSDFTAESVLNLMAHGAPHLAIVNDDAGRILKGWTMGKEGTRGAAYSFANGAWSGMRATRLAVTDSSHGLMAIRSPSLQLLLLTQPENGRDVVLGDDLQHGFGARCLITEMAEPIYSDELERPQYAPTAGDDVVISDFNAAILAHRKRQDKGMWEVGKKPGRGRVAITMTPSARDFASGLERTTYRNAARRSRKLKDDVMASRYSRSAEMMIRIAATNAAMRLYLAYGDGAMPDAALENVRVDAPDIINARAVVDWFNDEMARIAYSGAADKHGRAATRLLALIREEWDREGGSKYLKDDWGFLAYSLQGQRGTGGREAEAKRAVLETLLEAGAIGGTNVGGRYVVAPKYHGANPAADCGCPYHERLRSEENLYGGPMNGTAYTQGWTANDWATVTEGGSPATAHTN